MIDLVNLQKAVKLDLAVYRRFIKAAAKDVAESEGRPFSVAFIDDERMRQLNEMFRGKDSTTDVLSFPHEPDEFDLLSSPPYEGGVDAASADGVVLSQQTSLGDIAISIEQALKQAAENDLSLETEIKQLILHGLLHLCGHDHETDNGEMNTRELELRETLGI